ncbi:uncharacterized protein FA14DRAFT_77038 [Meira miltonrushii]|uniref:Uncharacterized protein n=1 Tax=Meira miltonrushii TaxID=1280837 RepID=A0A316VAZ5_9BASI|nr:uncharacterized protein FA14DRAFT_77038 [Meira miltonrushii]PWN32715.1 hypothetical protein FA14DRAFT_77038 [Meira miltonrushii]
MMDYSGTAITDKYPMRALCGKRYDNGFPFDSSSGGVPRTCFEDIVLVPLASWIFLVGLVGLIVFGLNTMRNQSSSVKSPLHRLVYRKKDAATLRDDGLLEKDGGNSPSVVSPNTWGFRHTKLASSLSILYSLLVIATLLMNILEIVRLYLADRGAGLLPFTLASIVIILVLMHVPLPDRMLLPTSALILTFWTFALVFTSVQLATLGKLAKIEPRTNTEYLNSDQQIDVGVAVGLYAIEFLVEGHRLLKLIKRIRQ